jgi:hypothetical protein
LAPEMQIFPSRRLPPLIMILSIVRASRTLRSRCKPEGFPQAKYRVCNDFLISIRASWKLRAYKLRRNCAAYRGDEGEWEGAA